MKIKFVGNPLDSADKNDVCRIAGKVFAKGEPVDVSDLPADMQRRLVCNHHFEVVEWGPKDAPADKPKRKRKGVSNGDDAGSDQGS